MRAVVSAFNRTLNSYQARTENDIAISFAIEDASSLTLNEVLDVDLISLLETRAIRRASNGEVIRVRLRDCDIHDLRLPSGHGLNRTPSQERMSAA